MMEGVRGGEKSGEEANKIEKKKQMDKKGLEKIGNGRKVPGNPD